MFSGPWIIVRHFIYAYKTWLTSSTVQSYCLTCSSPRAKTNLYDNILGTIHHIFILSIPCKLVINLPHQIQLMLYINYRLSYICKHNIKFYSIWFKSLKSVSGLLNYFTNCSKPLSKISLWPINWILLIQIYVTIRLTSMG